jgi:hypothetical protein
MTQGCRQHQRIQRLADAGGGQQVRFHRRHDLAGLWRIGGTFYNQGNLGADVQLADIALNAGWFRITSDLPQDRFKTTVGVDLKASDHWDVRLESSGEFADHFQSDTEALKVSYKF